jgi:hypothetical protein
LSCYFCEKTVFFQSKNEEEGGAKRLDAQNLSHFTQYTRELANYMLACRSMLKFELDEAALSGGGCSWPDEAARQVVCKMLSVEASCKQNYRVIHKNYSLSLFSL